MFGKFEKLKVGQHPGSLEISDPRHKWSWMRLKRQQQKQGPQALDFIPKQERPFTAVLREFLGKAKERVTKICDFQRSDSKGTISSLYSRKKIKFIFLNLAISTAKVLIHTKPEQQNAPQNLVLWYKPKMYHNQ